MHDKFGGCDVSSHLAIEMVSGEATVYYSALGKDVVAPPPEKFDSQAKAEAAQAVWDVAVKAAPTKLVV